MKKIASQILLALGIVTAGSAAVYADEPLKCTGADGQTGSYSDGVTVLKDGYGAELFKSDNVLDRSQAVNVMGKHCHDNKQPDFASVSKKENFNALGMGTFEISGRGKGEFADRTFTATGKIDFFFA